MDKRFLVLPKLVKTTPKEKLTKITKPDVSMLNDEQAMIFDEVTSTPLGYFSETLLTGYAGCGKSFVTTKIVEEFISRNKKIKIAVTAPTNKAVRVLKNLSPISELHPQVKFETLYKLLGMKRVISDTGKESFVADYQGGTIHKFDVIIVDEVSMLDNKLYQDLLSVAFKKMLFFIGDLGQIPPVNGGESLVFTNVFTHFELSKIMRQASDSEIIRIATKVRTGEPFVTETVVDENDNGVIFVDDSEMELLKVYFTSKNFKEDPNFVKVLAYHNKIVDKYNDLIRGMIYGEKSGRLNVGEKMVFNKPLLNSSKKVLFNNNDEFEVISFEKKIDGKFTYYATKIKCEGKRATIKLLAEESVGEWANELERLKQVALNANVYARKFAWVEYYNFMECYAYVKYNYCLTVHKCLPLDSKVLTLEGIKLLSDIHKEMRVISGNGNPQMVVDVVKTGVKDEFIIKTKSGREFISSAEHRYLSYYGYKEASEFIYGDHIMLWRSKKEHKFIFDLNYWALGYLVGDGCYSYSSNRVDVTILEGCDATDKIIEFFKSFGANVKIYKKANNNAITISAENKNLREWLLEKGLHRVTKAQKVCPKFSNINQQANFIQGLFDADGSCSAKFTSIRFVNVSSYVIDEVQFMLQQFGIIGRKYVNKVYSNAHNQSYTLNILGKDCHLFKNQIGFSISYKSDRLEKVCSKISKKTNVDFIPNSKIMIDYFSTLFSLNKTKGGRSEKGRGLFANKDFTTASCLLHGRLSFNDLQTLIDHCDMRGLEIPNEIRNVLTNWYFYDEIVSVGYSGKSVEMMDIEVSNDHSFIYNGAVVHNSQGSTFDNAIVILSDINKRWDVVERNKLLYTAITRVKNKLFLINE